MEHVVIDAHAHCGRQDVYPPQALEDYLTHVRGSDIRGAVMFAPVMEIYDRWDCHFEDNAVWRERRESANSYLLNVARAGFEVIPFFFIWNDFAVEQLTPRHKGIKWHRHPDEPRYRYDDPRCSAAIDEIRRRNMPVVLEEEWALTLRFIDELAPGVRVVIPHCGLLNGGYESFCRAGIWARPDIYTDTSLVPGEVVSHYVKNYGHSRIMFGSDFPFGDPKSELAKLRRLRFPEDIERAVTGVNVRSLLADSNL